MTPWLSNCALCRCQGAPIGMPSSLRLIRARDHAAVVVGEHDDRLVAKFGLKHALAGDVEIVAIDQSDRAAHGPSMRMLRVMTPQTSKTLSSDSRKSG